MGYGHSWESHHLRRGPLRAIWEIESGNGGRLRLNLSVPNMLGSSVFVPQENDRT